MSKKLVAYFSASGVTESVAKKLAKAAGADVYQIKPETPYTEADLNWMDKKSRSSIEMNDPNSRPSIAGKLSNMEDYDVIFVGFPIWWYDMPMAMYSFFDEYDFSGKTIIPFCTSGGSGFCDSIDAIKNLEPNADVVENGLAVSGSSAENAQNDISEWLSELGY